MEANTEESKARVEAKCCVVQVLGECCVVQVLGRHMLSQEGA